MIWLASFPKTIRDEHRMEEISILGINGDSFMSNHPCLMKNRRIRWVKIIAKATNEVTCINRSESIFFG
jgi:hypothetical protein